MQKYLPQFDFKTEQGVGDYWEWYNNKVLAHQDKIMVISPEQIPIKLNKGEY
jgi:hypothetical protein